MIDAALLLPNILARAGDNRELTETAAKIAWTRAAGEGLRQHAVALRLDETTLVVSVADAVWQKQLESMSSELVFRINKLVRRKVVERIQFRVDPAALNRHQAPRKQSDSKSAQPLPANVVSSAATIEDPELRERFIRAAENCIERRDSMIARR